MTKRNIVMPMALAGAFCLGAGTLAVAQDANIISIGELTCREYLKLEGDARSDVGLFMHGFIAGKANETTFDVVAKAAVSDRVLDHCIDNPAESLQAAFEAAEKK